MLLRAGLLLCLLVAAGGWSTVNSQAGEEPIFQAVDFKRDSVAGSSLPTDQVILTFTAVQSSWDGFDPVGAANLDNLSQAAGVELAYVRQMSGGAHVLRLPERTAPEALEAVIDRLAALPGVEHAEADLILTPTTLPDDPYYPYQWHYFEPVTGTYGINLPPAWAAITDWSPVVVAVLDTGITEHVEFIGMTVPGYDFISDVWRANDGDGRDPDPRDPGDWVAADACYPGSPARDSSWHGTHTAGTIGAASNNSIGVAGVNWGVKILTVRVLGRCGGYSSDIVDGMRWSAGLRVPGVPDNPNPARVLNLSLGGSGSCSASMQNAVNAVTAAGATIVVSAGNSNMDTSGFTPANCSGVISVAATNRGGDRASYSNYGSTVEISAPGGDGQHTNWVLSTYNTGTTVPQNDTYAWMAGTSMAAPHVSGAASLLYMQNPSITPTQVLGILQNTATPFPAGSTCTTAICGSGIVNAGAALSQPTAVVLRSFSALTGLDGITLAWETESEHLNQGFNLYRADAIDGSQVRINPDLVPSNPEKTDYAYLDAAVAHGETYFYWLEGVDNFGRSIFWSDPVEARVPMRIYLPLVRN